MKYYQSPQPEIFIKIRKELKMSQGRLARHLKVNKSTISRIEQGKQCPKPPIIKKLINLRTQLAARYQLAERPELTQIQQRLNHSTTLQELPKGDLNHVYWRLHDRLKNDKKQLNFLRNKLESAIIHSTLDTRNVDHLKGRQEHHERVTDLLIARNVREELVQHVADQGTASAKAHRRKKAHSVTLRPYQEMELREEIEQLEYRVESRTARLAEIKGLLEELELAAQAPVATTNSCAPAETKAEVQAEDIAATPAAPGLQVTSTGELTNTHTASDAPLRASSPRNVSPVEGAQRCVGLAGATLTESHEKRLPKEHGKVLDLSSAQAPEPQQKVHVFNHGFDWSAGRSVRDERVAGDDLGRRLSA